MHYPHIEPLEARIAPATLTLSDARVVEGNSGTAMLIFTATLSAAQQSAVTFDLATHDGTALAGSDYVKQSSSLSITAGMTTATFTVAVNGDMNFEATESLFVNLTNASSNVTVVNNNPIFPGAQATARGYIYNDDAQNLGANKAQWIDVDGDLVTLTVSKGQVPLTGASTTGANLFTFVSAGSVGGSLLQRLDFSAFGSLFSGASVSIIATKQAGFPDASNGTVDVGFIKGTIFDPSELRAVGVDLGTVTVDGDLAKLTAGDSFSTPAIHALNLGSLGARGTATLATDDAPSGSFVVESKVIGPVGAITVTGDVKGFLHVIGEEFGTIGSLKIGGALQGGTTDLSGAISVSGRLGSATIGSIVGSTGANSGYITASALGNGTLGNITVTGAITGGGGADSGEITAPKIGNIKAGSIVGGGGARSGYIFSDTTLASVTLSGDLTGGTAADAGEIAAQNGIGAVKIGGKIVGATATNTGSVRSGAGITSLAVAGTLVGGTGTGSGSILTARNIGAVSFGKNLAGDSIIGAAGESSGGLDIGGSITSFTAAGNVKGGAGASSGAIVAGGTIGKLVITGGLIGGSSSTAALDKTGYISAFTLTSASFGSIASGTAGTGSLTNSGAIRADVIGTLAVTGTVTGTAAVPVVISASGASNNLAIKSVNIVGNTAFAEILAGYNSTTSATNFRGVATSADASIGTVTFGGTVKGVDIVAGGITGADGRFGTADDALANGATVTDAPGVISKIASVVFKSSNAIVDNTSAYGIVAQYVASVKIGTTTVPLQAGAGNDIASSSSDTNPGIELGSVGSKFRALELLLPL